MRVAVIGNSGSGKSTLAQQLADAHALSALDLDTVAWEPGRIAIARSEDDGAADVSAFCGSRERWVVEGCYTGLVRRALEYSPILLFMDPGMEACLSNCRSRPWEPHKYGSQAEQDEKLEFLLAWVREYYSREGDLSLTAHQALFDEYRGPKLRLAHRDRPWLDDWHALWSRRGAREIARRHPPPERESWRRELGHQRLSRDDHGGVISPLSMQIWCSTEN